ncbi:HVO_0416 family zinc finger protein [Halosegnis sp.]|uniref:HVO_0416 family zinc finger protein n=1 Tax=Halosegnis sp. TaxID=2864959 RepID=UPI0035D50BE4
MATANDIFDEFLNDNGHDVEQQTWEEDYNKKRCPECGGLHEMSAVECSVCGWVPE